MLDRPQQKSTDHAYYRQTTARLSLDFLLQLGYQKTVAMVRLSC